MSRSFTNEMQMQKHFCITIKVLHDNAQGLPSIRVHMRDCFSPQSCF